MLQRDFYEIFSDILLNPFSPKGYRDLSRAYDRAGMTRESAALADLVEKFKHEPTDDTRSGVR